MQSEATNLQPLNVILGSSSTHTRLEPAPQIMERQYQEILEKTNQQLSLWYTPYNLSLTVLTLLVAFLAIFFAYIMWRQSREYKQAFNDFLKEAKEASEIETAKRIDAMQKEIDAAITEVSEKARQATGEEKQAAEKELEKLKKERTRVAEHKPITITGSVVGLPGSTYINPYTTLNYKELFSPVTPLSGERIVFDNQDISNQVKELKALVEKLLKDIPQQIETVQKAAKDFPQQIEEIKQSLKGKEGSK